MSQPHPALSPRQRFLQERQRRQNVTFAVTIVVMLVLALLSALILTGIVPVPFGNSFSKAEKFATSGKVPCPPEKTLPVDPASVKVQVLNTTSRQGIASEATEMLTAAGFAPAEPGNYSTEYAGTVEIDTGIAGVVDAYTVARFFPNSKVILTDATDKSVTVLLGTLYDGALNADEIQQILNSTDALTAPAQCLPLSDDDLERIANGGQSGAQSGQSGQSGETPESGASSTVDVVPVPDESNTPSASGHATQEQDVDGQ